jgi:hypothetical protein
MRHLRGFPLTLAFLIAFLIYNDGIQTVTTVAAQYGDKQLHLSDTVLLVAILIVQFVAFAGAIWLGRLAGRFGSKRVVLGSLIVWMACVGVGYNLSAGVIWQFFALAMVIALVLGGSQALSRSLFSLVVFFVVGFVLLLRVPVRRAVEAAGNQARRFFESQPLVDVLLQCCPGTDRGDRSRAAHGRHRGDTAGRAGLDRTRDRDRVDEIGPCAGQQPRHRPPARPGVQRAGAEHDVTSGRHPGKEGHPLRGCSVDAEHAHRHPRSGEERCADQHTSESDSRRDHLDRR